MQTLKFKSNIQCGMCLSKVSPFLNNNKEIKNWEVDLSHQDRILTVDTERLSVDEIAKTVSKAGFKAESIK